MVDAARHLSRPFRPPGPDGGGDIMHSGLVRRGGLDLGGHAQGEFGMSMVMSASGFHRQNRLGRVTDAGARRR